MFKAEITKLGVTASDAYETYVGEFSTKKEALEASDAFLSSLKQSYVNPDAVRQDPSFIRRNKPNTFVHNKYEVYPVFGWDNNVAKMLVTIINPKSEWI